MNNEPQTSSTLSLCYPAILFTYHQEYWSNHILHVADGGHGVHAAHGVRGGSEPGVGEARLIPGPVRNISYAAHAGGGDTLWFVLVFLFCYVFRGRGADAITIKMFTLPHQLYLTYCQKNWCLDPAHPAHRRSSPHGSCLLITWTSPLIFHPICYKCCIWDIPV